MELSRDLMAHACNSDLTSAFMTQGMPHGAFTAGNQVQLTENGETKAVCQHLQRGYLFGHFVAL